MSETFTTRAERPSDEPAILALQQAAFGPGAYARAAFRVREEAPHAPALSPVGLLGPRIVSSCRMTPVAIGAAEGLLLGPLVVAADLKNRGFGKALVRAALGNARRAGAGFVVLVGDRPYYEPFGFEPVPGRTVRLPGPADPERILVAILDEARAGGLAGTVRGVLRDYSSSSSSSATEETCRAM